MDGLLGAGELVLRLFRLVPQLISIHFIVWFSRLIDYMYCTKKVYLLYNAHARLCFYTSV